MEDIQKQQLKTIIISNYLNIRGINFFPDDTISDKFPNTNEFIEQLAILLYRLHSSKIVINFGKSIVYLNSIIGIKKISDISLPLNNTMSSYKYTDENAYNNIYDLGNLIPQNTDDRLLQIIRNKCLEKDITIYAIKNILNLNIEYEHKMNLKYYKDKNNQRTICRILFDKDIYESPYEKYLYDSTLRIRKETNIDEEYDHKPPMYCAYETVYIIKYILCILTDMNDKIPVKCNKHVDWDYVISEISSIIIVY